MGAYEKFIRDSAGEYLDHENFIASRENTFKELAVRQDKNAYDDGGIGTLSEKTVHAVLKNYIEPDKDYQEVAMDGFFADICRKSEIVEIQTRAFDRLRRKLDSFLNYYPVTVVYPMAVNKWIANVDKKTGERGSFRCSPLHLNEYHAFTELYKIKSRLRNPNLKIHLYMMDMEEYKMESSVIKRGRPTYSKLDRIPLGIRRIVTLDCPNDYLQFIPPELENGFTSGDFSVSAGISKSDASLALNILYEMGVVARTGKKGNSYAYEVSYL